MLNFNEMTLEIRKIENPKGNTLAFVNVEFPEIKLYSMRIVQGNQGNLFLAMPDRDTGQLREGGKKLYLPYYRLRPTDKDTLQEVILSTYSNQQNLKRTRNVEPPSIEPKVFPL